MDALPPDPYLALGLAKDATAGAIKTQYRKLVLKCHPDKIQDEALKQEAADKFHKIQSAYEIVGDEERRARYDAQCKLVELRRDVLGDGRGAPRNCGSDVRTAAYKMPTESTRGGDFYAKGPERYGFATPQYEERRPSYAQEDYFDQKARPTARKYDEYDRASKRSSPKEERPKPKASTKDAKENERLNRKEKSRRTEKEVRRDRDRKPMYATVQEDTSSDSDRYDGRARTDERAREEERIRAERVRDQWMKATHRSREADNGTADDRVRRAFTDAANYISRSREAVPQSRADDERRPSPTRMGSSKERVGVLRQDSGRPFMYRTGSGRPKATTRDSGRSTRDKERKPELVDEPREPRRGEVRERKPSLNPSRSAPDDIHVRPSFDRQRSRSMQDDDYKEESSQPKMRRSETMPTTSTSAAREPRTPRESSSLRPEAVYATPERTPEPESRSARFRYGKGQEYADDNEMATPDGYRTEVREPSGSRHRYTRSPSPLKDSGRDRQRSASSKHAAAPQTPPLPRTTSTQYVYPSAGREDSYSRPAISRENSGRLYGEIPRTTSSPRQSFAYSPPPERVSVRPSYGAEDVKFQTGYSRRSEKPSYTRGGSDRRQAVYA